MTFKTPLVGKINKNIRIVHGPPTQAHQSAVCAAKENSKGLFMQEIRYEFRVNHWE